MWYLPKAIYYLDLIDTMYAWAQATVYAENLIVYYAGQAEVVEHVGEVVPYSRVAVFATALGIEAVGLGNAAGLVVATDQVDSGRVAEFEADEEGDGFDAEEAAVDVVAYKDLSACLRRRWILSSARGGGRVTYPGTSSSYPDNTPQS